LGCPIPGKNVINGFEKAEFLDLNPAYSTKVSTIKMSQISVDPIFDWDKFLLKKKRVFTSEKYYVFDEAGNQILFIQRPAHLFRNVFLLLPALGIMVSFIHSLLKPMEDHDGLFSLIPIYIIFFATYLIIVSSYNKRLIKIYRDDTKNELLLYISKEQNIESSDTILILSDLNRNTLAEFRYVIGYQDCWYCYTKEGLLCVAKPRDHFFGWPNTHFIILKGESNQVIGELDRKKTLRTPLLEMKLDKAPKFDRRIALALGVLLDTGNELSISYKIIG